jgi:hypothetical protein
MSRVLVVARTRMNQGRVCVGGHDLDPPHVEDLLVSEGKRIETLPLDEVRALILKNETPWGRPRRPI